MPFCSYYAQDPARLKQILVDASTNPGPVDYPDFGMPQKNIGFNGLRHNNSYNFPRYDKKMPFLIDEVGGIKWVKGQDKANSDTQSWRKLRATSMSLASMPQLGASPHVR